MNDLDLDAVAMRPLSNTPQTANPADWRVLLTPEERDALVAEVRRLRAIEDAAREVATVYYSDDASLGDLERVMSKLLKVTGDARPEDDRG